MISAENIPNPNKANSAPRSAQPVLHRLIFSTNRVIGCSGHGHTILVRPIANPSVIEWSLA